MKILLGRILSEINSVLMNVDEVVFEQFVGHIALHKNNKIVCIGAGRVGYAIRGFCMRLGHMGYNAWFIGDTTVPRIGEGDLLIVASGSGQTKTILDLTTMAVRNRTKVICVTGKIFSDIAKLADFVLELSANSYTDVHRFGKYSRQPMTTLNEQCLGILFDAMVLRLMESENETNGSMLNRHSNLE